MKKKVHGTPWGSRVVQRIPDLEELSFYRKLKKMGKRHNFDYPHSAQVCRLSLALFDCLEDELGLRKRDRRLLMAGSLLHDIGAHRRKGKKTAKRPQKRPKSTAGHEHHHHHKRGQRIILKEGVPGLDPIETKIVASIARYHTKAAPHKKHSHYRHFSKNDKRRVRKLSALVRIADSLDRRHASMVRDLRCNFSDDGEELTIWVFCKKHAFDWRPKHRTGLFEKEFGAKVRIQVLFGTAVG
jgi:exopolyphosphatase/guanosine-5'-triphosphate,3'-diphosphate pyrophosphatase